MLRKQFSFNSRFTAVYEINENLPSSNSNISSRSIKYDFYETNSMATGLPNHPTNSNIQMIQKKIKQKQNNIIESLITSEHHLTELMEHGASAAKELNRQREQLEKTKRNLDEIHNDLHTTKKHIREISGFFGRLRNYFTIKKNKKTKRIRNYNFEETNQQTANNKKDDKSQSTSAKARGIECISYREKSFEESDNFNDVVDCRLRKINDLLGSIKDMAACLDDELNSQEPLIDDLNNGLENNNTRVKKQIRSLNTCL